MTWPEDDTLVPYAQGGVALPSITALIATQRFAIDTAPGMMIAGYAPGVFAC